LCRHHHRLLHEGAYTAAVEHGRPTFRRPDGTPIAPPPRSPLDHHRRHRRPAGITRHTAVARSGGAPHWSPQHALDALLSRRWPQVALDPG
jgi:hypothetical protein